MEGNNTYFYVRLYATNIDIMEQDYYLGYTDRALWRLRFVGKSAKLYAQL